MKRKRSVSGYNPSKKARVQFAKVERKYFDSNVANDTIPVSSPWSNSNEVSPTSQGCLFCPIQGTGINQRIAKKCAIHSINIRGLLDFNPIAASATVRTWPPLVRIVLFINRDPRGMTCDVSHLLGGATGTVNSYRNVDFLNNFKILRDVYLKMPEAQFIRINGTDAEYDSVRIPFKMKYNFKKPLEVYFSGNDNSYASLQSNSIQLAMGTGGNTPGDITTTYSCRITYTDV